MLFRRGAARALLGAGAVTVVALAVTAAGSPTQHLTLNDGGVWVINGTSGAWGRFNKPIGQLDAALFPESGGTDLDLDVLQEGPDVVLRDRGAGTLRAVDVQLRSFAGDPVPFPAAGQVDLRGGTLATLDGQGTLRALHVDSGAPDLTQVGPSGPPLASRLPAGTQLTVTTGGTVIVAAGTSLRRWSPSEAGFAPMPPLRLATPGASGVRLTSVGETPVVLDPASRTLSDPVHGRRVEVQVDAHTAVLQQPGPSSSAVVLADRSDLVRWPLSGGAATVVSSAGKGTPARPTVLGSCVHMAWAGSAPAYLRACGDTLGPTSTYSAGDASTAPVFRVNRDQIVLNDVVSGAVYLADQRLVSAGDVWKRLDRSQDPQAKVVPHHDDRDTNRKPQPKDDAYGVRSGVSASLHVLDNDSDPDGDVLSVVAVTDPSGGATMAVSQDRQSLIATMPASGAPASTRVRYTVSDGKATAQAQVTIEVHGSDVNGLPRLREHYEAPHWVVAPSGVLRMPVLGDWRDPDGDPLYLDSARASGGTVSLSGDALVLAAPARPGELTLTYAVTDGHGQPVQQRLTVTVVDPGSGVAVAATARPDVVQTRVGVPTVVKPLANDVPGADPSDPTARLSIAAEITSPDGLRVDTDLARGRVTVTALREGTYLLKYQAGFGTATPSSSVIRVDVLPATGDGGEPVAAPDVLVLRGQRAGSVDVLANDYDPSGSVLVVQDASTGDDSLQVSVVDGRSVRVSSSTGQAGTTRVTYRVSNGRSRSTGVVSVVVLEASTTNAPPVAVDDLATVRAGDVTSVAVLDNDSDPDGDPISLAPVPPTAQPVIEGLGMSTNGGRLLVAAPSTLTKPEQTVVSYVVQDGEGARTTGHVSVSLVPAGDTRKNRAPAPPDLEARMTAGDTVTVTVPVYGIDPDGDSATVTGVVDAPRLGRVVAVGPDTITYQSYPQSVGTDSFTYEVQDAFGAAGRATVRVGIVAPGLPVAPVAVDDDITAAPGRTVHVDVLANDSVPSGSVAKVLPLATVNPRLPAGVFLSGSIVTAPVPARGAAPLRFAYQLSNGVGEPAGAFVTVSPLPGATIAPIARDDVPSAREPATGQVVPVDVLKNDDDPDGAAGTLMISRVFDADVQIAGSELQVPVTAHARQMAYEVRDADGLTALAVVRVPAGDRSTPHLKDGARIVVPLGGSETVPLAQVAEGAPGATLRVTVADTVSSSPEGKVSVKLLSTTSLSVSAAGGYSGPGAVSLEVTDGANASSGHTARITVPVQVGPPAPALRCPADPVQVIEGGEPFTADLMAYCHVWTDSTADPITVTFTAKETTAVAKTSVSVQGATSLSLLADAGAAPGSRGEVTVSVPGTPVSATLPFVVVEAPPLTVGHVTVPGLVADRSVTIDLAQYARSPLRGGRVVVESARQRAGETVALRTSGSQLTLTPGHDTNGAVTFDLTLTDVPGRSDRSVPVTLATQVESRPSRPGAPPVASVGNKQVVLSWSAPDSGGSPITGYTVSGGEREATCPASPCTIAGLANDHTYRFTVLAHNAIGDSDPSPQSANARPDSVPTAVSGITLTPGDHQLRATWPAPAGDFSAPDRYQLDVQPGGLQYVQGTSTTLTGLTNGTTYRVRVRAHNGAGTNGGWGPWGPVVTEVPFGTPARPDAPTATGATTAPGDKQRSITVSWSATSGTGNGRDVTAFTVTQQLCSGGGVTSKSVPGHGAGDYQTTFSVSTDGASYCYSLTVTNSGGLTSPSSPMSAPVRATAPPDTMPAPTATDHDAGSSAGYDGRIHVSFVLPASNATSLTQVQYRLNGSSTGTFGGLATTQTISGLQNGTTYRVEVRGCNDAGECGTWSDPSGAVTPYGPPGPPAVSASMSGNVVSYSWSGGGGNGRAVDHYHVCITAKGCTDGGAGSWSHDYGYSADWSISVSLVDSAGQTSTTVTRSGRTPAEPPAPSVTLRRGDPVYLSSGSTAYKYLVTLNGFAANTRYGVSCRDTASPNGFYTFYVTTGSSGSGANDNNNACYSADGPDHWVVVNGVTSNRVSW
jgi:large repetitive protein